MSGSKIENAHSAKKSFEIQPQYKIRVVAFSKTFITHFLNMLENIVSV